MQDFLQNRQYYKFCFYGFLRNLRFFEAFLLLFLLDKGMSYSQIGILYAIHQIVLNLFEVPSGIMADAWGRKYTLAASFIVFIISFVVFYFSSGFVLFLFAFALFGIADAFRSGIHKAMMTDYLEINSWIEHRTAYYGHTRAWSQRGLAVSSLGAGLIVFFAGSYQSIFLYSIIPYLFNFILLLSYPDILNRALKKGKTSRRKQIGNTLKDFWVIIKQPKVFALITNSAAHTAYQKSIKDYIQPAMVAAIVLLPFFEKIEVKQKNGLFIGIIYFIIYLITSNASKLAGYVSNKKLRWASNISFLVGLTAGVFVGLFFKMEFWWITILMFATVFIVENFRKPIITSRVAESVPNAVLATVLSAQSQLKTIIAVILSLTLGFFADWFGVGFALLVVSLLLALLYVCILYLQKMKSEPNNKKQST
jgi:MFS family permease